MNKIIQGSEASTLEEFLLIQKENLAVIQTVHRNRWSEHSIENISKKADQEFVIFHEKSATGKQQFAIRGSFSSDQAFVKDITIRIYYYYDSPVPHCQVVLTIKDWKATEGYRIPAMLYCKIFSAETHEYDLSDPSIQIVDLTKWELRPPRILVSDEMLREIKDEIFCIEQIQKIKNELNL